MPQERARNKVSKARAFQPEGEIAPVEDSAEPGVGSVLDAPSDGSGSISLVPPPAEQQDKEDEQQHAADGQQDLNEKLIHPVVPQIHRTEQTRRHRKHKDRYGRMSKKTALFNIKAARFFLFFLHIASCLSDLWPRRPNRFS